MEKHFLTSLKKSGVVLTQWWGWNQHLLLTCLYMLCSTLFTFTFNDSDFKLYKSSLYVCGQEIGASLGDMIENFEYLDDGLVFSS